MDAPGLALHLLIAPIQDGGKHLAVSRLPIWVFSAALRLVSYKADMFADPTPIPAAAPAAWAIINQRLPAFCHSLEQDLNKIARI